MATTLLTADDVVSRLQYDEETGSFFWKDGKLAGRRAGTLNRKGYRYIYLKGMPRLAHRLVVLMKTGSDPASGQTVDHINGCRDDNRWGNLRVVSLSTNLQNQRLAQPKNHSTGLLGVTFIPKRGVFQAQIRVAGKTRWLGYFETKEQAHEAYVAAKRELHEGCTI